jgi:hypothetical protein
MTLNTKLAVSLSSSLTTALDLVSASAPLKYNKNMVLSSGTGLGAADKIFSDTRTLAASGTENLDLSGSLTDSFGAVVTFARIKLVLVTAAVGNTNNVNFAREGTNGVPLFLAASDGIAVKPGGGFAWWSPDAAGVVVTAATGDLLTVTNSGAGTGVTYDVVIIGASA